MHSSRLANHQGFTLIEIIAVLVILGILAVVAIPKFFDMQVETEKISLNVALSDMNSRAATVFAKSMLENNGKALVGDVATFTNLGLAGPADVAAAYSDFAGIWGVPAAVTIGYTLQNGGSIATFTLTPGAATTAPSVILSF